MEDELVICQDCGEEVSEGDLMDCADCGHECCGNCSVGVLCSDCDFALEVNEEMDEINDEIEDDEEEL